METTALQFASTARTIAAAAHARGLDVPGFRTPPRTAGVDRTLRRGPGGHATVSVVVKGRPVQAVVADLIEGVVVLNELSGPEATRARTALWEAVVADHRHEAA